MEAAQPRRFTRHEFKDVAFHFAPAGVRQTLTVSIEDQTDGGRRTLLTRDGKELPIAEYREVFAYVREVLNELLEQPWNGPNGTFL